MNLLNSLNQIPSSVIFVVYIWTIIWKGLALWKSANLKQRNWFVVLLVVNTLGILEIVYLFYFATKRMKLKELMFWETK